MARYKVLKSAAHGLAQSFASTLNYRDNDYVMGHLLRAARASGVDTFRVDLMDGTCAPDVLATAPVRAAAEQYSQRVPDLVVAHGSAMEHVGAGHLEVRFDLNTQRESKWSEELESPFTCRVVLTDDRGKEWPSQIEDWWFPETPPQQTEPDSVLGKVVDQLRGLF